MLLKNSRAARRKYNEAYIHTLQQLWKVVSEEILVNAPSQTWWNKLGPKTLSPAMPEWKLEMDTSSILFKSSGGR
jgi:hypothetical protein